MPEGVPDVQPQVLDRSAVAALIGVKPTTVTRYLNASKPGRRYADRPFPRPDGHVGDRPYWLAERTPEIQQWALGRPGRGIGGGRPWPART